MLLPFISLRIFTMKKCEMLEHTKTCRKTSLCLIVFEAAFLSLAEIPVSNFFEKFFEPEFFLTFRRNLKRSGKKIERV